MNSHLSSMSRKPRLAIAAIAAVAFGLALAGCGQSPIEGITSPVSTSPVVSPATGEAKPAVQPTELPTPEAGKGTVKGTLIEYTSKTPITDGLVLLLTVTQDTQGMLSIVEYDPITSLRVPTGDGGTFAFANVIPTVYYIGAFSSRGPVILLDPETRREISVTVKAGEFTDVGSVYLDLLSR